MKEGVYQETQGPRYRYTVLESCREEFTREPKVLDRGTLYCYHIMKEGVYQGTQGPRYRLTLLES